MLLLRYVAVPVNYSSKPCRFRLQIDERQIMKYVNRSSAEFNHIGLWQLARPYTLIDIAAYGSNGRNQAEFIENLRSTHVPCVNDVFGPA